MYHSHPDAPPVPSPADQAGACSGWSHVIVSVSGASGESELRSFEVADRVLVEERVVVGPVTQSPRTTS